MTTSSFTIQSLDTFVLRAPISEPVRTAFGSMHDRASVLIRVIDGDGITGWGEIWSNFPSCGAEHRARLVETEIAPLILGQHFTDPSSAYYQLTDALHLLALQTGEPGPVAQAIAGTDIALWDLYAHRQQRPLWQLLGAGSARLPVYASGINPTASAQTALTQLENGFRAFKLKVGFDDNTDIENARAIREAVGNNVALMVDANQGWDLDRAKKMTVALSEFNLKWIEEPLPVDTGVKSWVELKKQSPTPLAGGENLRGFTQYRRTIASATLDYIQPDAGKWGGITGCLAVGREIREAGLCYCPHWLGAGVGLMASAHLLAAVGGDGFLEIDSNPNPLRDQLVDQLPAVDDGYWTLSDAAGLGVSPDAQCIARYRIESPPTLS